MSITRIKRTDSEDTGFVTLTQELSAVLAILNGEQNDFYVQHNRIDTIRNAIVAYSGDQPIACGAFRAVDGEVVEIKRMYVQPELRGTGIGWAVLQALEEWAGELGYSAAILETSRRLEPAVRLYTRSGYALIPNYGPYVGVDDSVCMRKAIESSVTR
ncbi:MAG: GNAT family N-acetyltransferase [Fimbriimonas sp.]|nr:GNAT family N-acetyltransferase [Fimbriimonas sp.]